jgi:hypothetical protein
MVPLTTESGDRSMSGEAGETCTELAINFLLGELQQSQFEADVATAIQTFFISMTKCCAGE